MKPGQRINVNGHAFELLQKGSPFYGGNSLVAIGQDGPGTSTADGAEYADSFELSEPGVIDRLIALPDVAGIALSEFKIDNDHLITGFVPIGMLSHDAFGFPGVGHVVDVNSKVSFKLQNESGAAIVPYVAALCRPLPPEFDQYRKGDNVYRQGRSLIAIGGPEITTVGAGASATLTFSITEAGVLGRLFIDWTGDEAECVVTSIKHNNDEMLTGEVPGTAFYHNCTSSPVFGHFVDINDKLTITVKNLDGANPAEVLAGFACL